MKSTIRLLTATVYAFIGLGIAAAQAAGPANGLYLMSQYVYGGGLSLDAYYFKDGQVARSPASDTAQFDFAAAKNAAPANVGQISVDGSRMTVRWGDNSSNDSQLDMKPGDPCFDWNGGIFCPVTPFAAGTKLSGTFEGGLSTGNFGGNVVSNLRAVTFAEDGTYKMDASSTIAVEQDTPNAAVAAGSSGGEQGTYLVSGTDLKLLPKGGRAYDVLAFPYNRDDNSAVKPDSLYFGGTMLKRQ